MAFYELRQYEVRPGKMAQWLALMEEEIIPFQVAKGMVIPGSFRGETDDSVYVWLRRFESEAERERLYAAVYQNPHWKSSISPRIGELMASMRATDEEAPFYGLEQRSLRANANTPISVRVASWLYEHAADYGRSFLRPLVWLGGSFVAFGLVYFAALTGQIVTWAD